MGNREGKIGGGAEGRGGGGSQTADRREVIGKVYYNRNHTESHRKLMSSGNPPWERQGETEGVSCEVRLCAWHCSP